MSVNRYPVSKRRYNEKIADIIGETVDIIEESLIYFDKYQAGYASVENSKQKSWKSIFQLKNCFQFVDHFLLRGLVVG